MKQKYQSIRMFKSDALESLSHIHPATPFVVWIPIISYLMYLAAFTHQVPITTMAGLYFGGLVFWTFAEYALHRFVFHFPAKNKVTKYLVFLSHGVHHDDPQDPTRLVMPPALSIPLSIPFYLGFKALFGASLFHSFFGGFLTGYLIYDFIHYATHHFRMQSPIGKKLKEYHMKHHYVAHEAKWGVSSPLWDHIFGTTETPKNN